MENSSMPSTALGRWSVKIRHIVPVLVYIVIGSVLGLMVIRWLLIQVGVELKQEIWSLWIPLVFPWIPILIWLRHKIRILTRDKDEDRLRTFYQVMAWFAMAAPLFISQAYMNEATGSMLKVENLGELKKQPLSRYYTIKDFGVDTAWVALGEDIRVSGRHNETLNINFFFVVPMVDLGSDIDTTADRVCWYGVKYHHSISNRASDAIKEQQYNAAFNGDLYKFRTYAFHNVDYFKRTPSSEDLDGFLSAVERVSSTQKEKAVILEPVVGSFDSRGKSKVEWIFGSALIGIAIYILLLTFPRYDPEENENQRHKRKPESDDVKDMLLYLIPREPHFVTSIILDICVLVMIVMLFTGVHPMSPNGVELMEWGANRRTETLDGQWWRLITSMFVHGGLVHLIFNLYGLVMGAMFLEEIVGPKRYAIIYFVSGIMASIASIVWHPHVASVGASGAIFGLFGANLALTLTGLLTKVGKRGLLTMFGPYVGLNLVLGFFLPGIDNAAHIGGLVSGFLIGFVIFKQIEEENPELEEDPQIEDKNPELD